ncbi:MAG: hypothetical protein D3903_12595 [Candidatus Electrothrix sp. GM3_4]|nr:hypothetical protein [Candidatus Electrothrix sp. GM3_4]
MRDKTSAFGNGLHGLRISFTGDEFAIRSLIVNRINKVESYMQRNSFSGFVWLHHDALLLFLRLAPGADRGEHFLLKSHKLYSVRISIEYKRNESKFFKKNIQIVLIHAIVFS